MPSTSAAPSTEAFIADADALFIETQTFVFNGTISDDEWVLRMDPASPATWMYFGDRGYDRLTLDFSDVTQYIDSYSAGVDILEVYRGWSVEIYGMECVEIFGGNAPLWLYMPYSACAWIVHGGAANDLLRGGQLGDSLDGGLGADLVEGHGGNDTLSGGTDGGGLYGGDGDDELRWLGGGGSFFGDAGIDTVRFDLASGVRSVSADLGAGRGSAVTAAGTVQFTIDSVEVVHGALAASNQLTGGAGAETLIGGDASDTLSGGAGNDSLLGGLGRNDLRDVILGGAGDDTIDGGYGNDSLRGDDGNDTVEGGFGADTLVGGTGNDVLTGSAWSDLIFGNDGDDFINGGFGNDRVNGGAGADRFYHLGVAGHGSDWIQDYSATDGDRLVFGNTASTRDQFQINWATTPGAGDSAVQEAFVIYRPSGQILWALIDGAAQDHILLQIGATVHDLMA